MGKPTFAWLKRIRRFKRGCPSCGDMSWANGGLEPVALLLYPATPLGHPELEHGMDGTAVLPVTCKACGYVGLYSVEHMRKLSPWDE